MVFAKPTTGFLTNSENAARVARPSRTPEPVKIAFESPKRFHWRGASDRSTSGEKKMDDSASRDSWASWNERTSSRTREERIVASHRFASNFISVPPKSKRITLPPFSASGCGSTHSPRMRAERSERSTGGCWTAMFERWIASTTFLRPSRSRTMSAKLAKRCM